MTKKKKIMSTISTRVPDDVLALSLTYSLPYIKYVDVQKQEQLDELLDHWTLLGELAELSAEESPKK